MDKFNWRSISGWFSEADSQFVLNMLKTIKDGICVEIGCFKGRSTAVMMPAAIKNNNEYYVIDNFYGGKDETTPASKIQRCSGEQIKKEFIENMKMIGMRRSDYRLWRCNSIDASVYFPDQSLDLVFLDGDHAYESVKLDIETWWKKIKKNGIIAGHDINNEDVSRAVKEFLIKNNITIFSGGNCWGFNKNV